MEAWARYADDRSERVLLAYGSVRKAQQRGEISTEGVGFSCIRTSSVVYERWQPATDSATKKMIQMK